MDAARTLREARTRAGLTQAALATRAGTSQATLSAYENARKQPSLETLSRLLNAAGQRLTIEATPTPVIQPSAAQHRMAAKELGQVLALADALPKRHPRRLRFPRLENPAA